MEAVKFYYKNTELKPYKAYETDAGWDLRSAINTVIEPLTYQFIPTGIKTAIPKGYFGKIEARSSLALKGLITMAGVIDSGYRGEIKVGIFNAGKEPIKIEKGMRIAQIIIHRIKLDAEYVGEDAINETARGEKGFGSTGTK